MLKTLVCGFTLSVAFVGVALGKDLAEAKEGTPKYYLSKSDAAVAGQIITDPTLASTPPLDDAGTKIVMYMFEFKVEEVLDGDVKDGSTIGAIVQRFEVADGDKLPVLKKGGQCILFLNKDARTMKRPDGSTLETWASADEWFGVQSLLPSLAETLRKLGKGE